MSEGSAARATPAPSIPAREAPADAALPRVDDTDRWAFERAAHIRAGRFDPVDLLNVADEIESAGKSEFKSFASGLEVTLPHTPKWDHQPSRRSRSRVNAILEHRRRAREDFHDSPSLRTREALRRAHGCARLRASTEPKRKLGVFPAVCPYAWERIMEAPYAPDGE